MAVTVPGSNPSWSPDFSGSRDEYVFRAATAMANRYAAGDQSMIDTMSNSWGPVGSPNGADFGKNQVSMQTFDFFTNYIQAYGSNDTFVSQAFGTEPTRAATMNYPMTDQQKVDAQAKLDAANNASSEKIAAGHDASNLAAAQASAAAQVASATISANASIANTTAQVNESWKEATLSAATQRYVAEGNWGTQKYVAELQEKGQMDRLLIANGQDDKHLAQDALTEADRHHEAMLGLVNQVAQIDANLAAQPRNWIAYASWLQNRGMIVNGLTLATAAQVVPQQAISPAETANSATAAQTGGGVAAAQQQAAITQQATMGPGGENVNAATTQSFAGDQQQNGTPVADTTLASQAPQQGTQPAAVNGLAKPGGIDLNSTDYTAIANQLLGLNPLGTTAPTTAQLQQSYDSLGNNSAHQSGFGAWGGATQNSLGMTVNPEGQKIDLRKFSNLLPAQQDMTVGAASSVGKYEPDFTEEMKRAAPKGGLGSNGAVATWG